MCIPFSRNFTISLGKPFAGITPVVYLGVAKQRSQSPEWRAFCSLPRMAEFSGHLGFDDSHTVEGSFDFRIVDGRSITEILVSIFLPDMSDDIDHRATVWSRSLAVYVSKLAAAAIAARGRFTVRLLKEFFHIFVCVSRLMGIIFNSRYNTGFVFERNSKF